MGGFELFVLGLAAVFLGTEIGIGLGDVFLFGFNKLGDGTVEGVFGEAVVVDPEGVGAGFGGEGPVDGGLAAALAVAFEVVFEELAAGFLLGEVVAQGADAEDLAGFLLNGGTAVAPDDGDGVADTGDDVLGVAGGRNEDAGPGYGQRVVVGQVRLRGGQTVGALEHAGRTDGQRVEGIGQLGRLALAGGVADVPAAQGATEQIRNLCFSLSYWGVIEHKVCILVASSCVI